MDFPITSRKNSYLKHMRQLGADRDYRGESGEYVCDGLKLLNEAAAAGCEITSVLWKNSVEKDFDILRQYAVSEELYDYVSPLKNSPGPLFSVKMKPDKLSGISSAIVLENVGDPGNVGTVIRSARAFGIDAVICVGACADIYNPKTVRSTMGAVFTQNIIRTDLQGLKEIVEASSLRLIGTALHTSSEDIRSLNLKNSAVCIGNEGSGLSAELMDMCFSLALIPMEPACESLNAAQAATICMWEMYR